MQPSRNIAARAGRWSARHWKTAVAGWLAFVAIAFLVGGNVGTQNLTTEEAGVGDSGAASSATVEPEPQRASA